MDSRGELDLPGFVNPEQHLDRCVRSKVLDKGKNYLPRTKHLNRDGSPQFVNRLIGETSPYLLQHAHNPVNWHSWTDETLAKAKEQGKPILLSVGYATCHWCHVMERESFEDLEIAALINQHFIPIKVDREERPDVDALYMKATQLLSGRGGWPMTVMMTPDREPYFAGTYFPARTGDRASQKGFLEILKEMIERYDSHPEQVVDRATKVSQRIQELAKPHPAEDVPKQAQIDAVVSYFETNFNSTWGGFGEAPNFPEPARLELLMRVHNGDKTDQSRNMAMTTLARMAEGGIHDHVGGGFHRYSTDQRWLKPHFEKMLYDNAQLASSYIYLWQITEDAEYARIARRVLTFMERDMMLENGAFISATDADSPDEGGVMEEGAFFTWTQEEIRQALPASDAKVMIELFSVDGAAEGRSVLSRTHVSSEEQRPSSDVIDDLLEKLRAKRGERTAPLNDDKVLTPWNGLTISAFAKGAAVFDDPSLELAAVRGAQFAIQHLQDEKGFLYRTHRAGTAKITAFSEDYTHLIQGLLDLHEVDPDPEWLAHALRLQSTLDKHYWDAENGGYYRTSDQAQALLVRMKPDEDGVNPSANSVAAHNLLRLSSLTGNADFRRQAEKIFTAYSYHIETNGPALCQMLSSLSAYLQPLPQVVIVGEESARKPLERAVSESFLPSRVLIRGTAEEIRKNQVIVAWLEHKDVEGGPMAFVCEQGSCKQPTSDPDELSRQLEHLRTR